MLLEVRWETKRPFLVSTEILGFLSIFKKSQASDHFEAFISVCLSRCQGYEPPCPDEVGPRAISRDFTEDSDSPSSCEMKEEPEFKPLHRNLTFF